jgi:Bacterial type II and III secretion system protein
MNTKQSFVVATVTSLVASTAFAQFPGRTGEEFSGIQNRVGNPSPNAGFSTGETNSRIDDYVNQDEQINIDPLTTGVVKVLRVNQKNLINDFVTRIVKINNVTPREIREMLKSVTGIEGGRAEVIIDKTTKENWVQLIAPTFMMPSLESAVQALDEKWLKQAQDGSDRRIYYAKWRPAETIDTFASRYAGEGVSQLDATAQAIARRDEPFRVEEYFKGAAVHDIAPPQALFKFNIYEITSSNDYLVGVDWVAWKNGPGRSLFELILGGQDTHNRFDNATGNFDPNLGALTVNSLGEHGRSLEVDQYLLSGNYLLTSAYLDFLRVKGKARVVASPEIFALTHKTATWSATDQFLSYDVTPSSPDALGIKPTRLNKDNVPPATLEGGVPTGSSEFSAHNRFLRHNVGPKNSVGLTLKIFAAIGQESSEVEVSFESTDLAGTTPQGTPIITNRKLVVKQRMKDGQAQVLGSMIRDEEIHGADKAPGLGSIPLVGFLFGREAETQSRKEIVITVVPHIYPGKDTYAPNNVEGEVQLRTMQMAMPGAGKPDMPAGYKGFDAWLFEEAAVDAQ